jgi:hypothetical protein
LRSLFLGYLTAVPAVGASRCCGIETAAWIPISPPADPTPNVLQLQGNQAILESYSGGVIGVRPTADFGKSENGQERREGETKVASNVHDAFTP